MPSLLPSARPVLLIRRPLWVSLFLTSNRFCIRCTASFPLAPLPPQCSNSRHFSTSLQLQLFSTSLSSSDSSDKKLSSMPTMNTWKVWKDGQSTARSTCILPLCSTAHKGSSGRIVVIGGSPQYTGAPFYAAMAALRTGADLATVLCAAQAAIPIKSYSPELMVLPMYDAESGQETIYETMVETVLPRLERIHCLLIGPGLGRDVAVFKAVGRILAVAREKRIPIVLDADALFALSTYRDALRGYEKLVLTPNKMEYSRMMTGGVVDEEWSRATIVQKGAVDCILQQSAVKCECHELGSLKRPGGIGDVLAGVTATLVAWHEIQCSTNTDKEEQSDRLACCCWTACCIVKKSARKAFEKHHRAMSATHVLDELGPVFQEMIDE